MVAMLWMGWVGCGWFTSPEPEPTVTATASVTNRAQPVVAGEPEPLTPEQLIELDELFARSTELVREGEPGAFRSATITFVQTHLEEFHPERGESVTVVPVEPSLPPQTLRVTEVVETEQFVQLTTSSTSDPAWLAAKAPEGERPEMIGHATLLHPANPAARAARAPADLPGGISAETLVAGVDVTSDRFADVITSEHCCDDPSLPANEACDGGTCRVTWVRNEGGWRVSDES